MLTEKKDNNKWIVLLGCWLLSAALQGIINNCASLYIIPVTEDLGWLRSQYSLAQTISFASCMCGAMFSWRIYRRFGLMRTLKAGTLSASIVYMSYAFASTMGGFYIRALICGLCLGLASTVPVALIVRKWFPDNYATAVGIAMMGSGLGGAFFNLIAEHILTGFGWRRTFFVLGIIMLVTANIAAFVMIQDKPSEIRRVQGVNSGKVPRKVTLAILLCVLITMFSQGNLLYNITPYLQDIGYSEAFAAKVSAFNFLILGAGKLLQGHIIDKKGMRFTLTLIYCFGIVSMIALVKFVSPWMLLIIMPAVLIVTPFSTVASPALPGFIYDEETRGKAVGWFNAATSGGLALMPTIAAAFYDFSGSYAPFFAITAGLTAVVLFIFRKLLPQ